MAGTRNVKPLAYKDTFWNTVRVERGIKIRELAELLDMSVGIIGMYFSGQAVPTEKTIKDLCTIFDVDELKGTQEFHKANKSWDAEHKRTPKVRASSNVVLSEETSEDTPAIDPVDTKGLEDALKEFDIKVDKVKRLIYNKVSYDDFEAITEEIRSGSDVLAVLYNHRIDFDTYMLAVNIFYGDR